MKKQIHKAVIIFIFFAILLIMGVTYVTWRWMYTLNLFTSPLTTFWSYTLCVAEILTFIVFTNFALILIKSYTLEKVVPTNRLQNDYLKDVYYNGELVTYKNFAPSVDIFICTLNEPVDMLSTTIAGCVNIDYPNFKVYVLDDGRREEVRELAKLLGAEYITRNTNKGYKAGNINNALSLTNGEIVAVFDADHVPASTFLKETVYNFTDDKVALVQTPQHFCNPDAFQKNLELTNFLANEQELFYRIIEPSLGEYNSVLCGGTNILLRRIHLASVGNFPENTITEDSLLGLIFHAYRFKVVYYNRPIAIGLAASSFEEYIKQRCRWSKGNVQILTNPQNWKYYFSLTFAQAFFHLSGVLYFFTPISRLIYLAAPVMFLFFDVSPILILFYQIIAFQVCYFSLKFLFIFLSRARIGNILLADVYDLVTSVFTVGGVLQTLLIPPKLAKFKFSVTKKETGKEKTNYKYKTVLLIIFAILLWAELQGFYDIFFSHPYSVLAIVANLFWNTINLLVTVYGIKVVSEKPDRRHYQRIDVDEKLVVKDDKNRDINIHVNNISRSGASISSDDLKNLSGTDINIKIDGDDNAAELIACQETNGQYVCKSRFKSPIELSKLSKQYIDRLVKFVKFTYKSPDKWDDYFN